MKSERLRTLNGNEPGPGPVVYWMSRDQRLQDNWALSQAQAWALERRAPLAVVFCLAEDFFGATARQYDFLLRGLRGCEAGLAGTGIPFFLLAGNPGSEIARFAAAHRLGTVVTDFDPQRIKRRWKEELVRQSPVTLYEVDAHNLVPCWIASAKREYAARTFRPRLLARLGEFLESAPALMRHPFAWPSPTTPVDWEGVRAGLKADRAAPPVSWIEPGEQAARRALARFLAGKLARYGRDRNDPTAAAQSDLSPYLHFGQLAALRIVREVGPAGDDASRLAFLEELIVRRELADNFCFHEPRYDSAEAFPDWARRTLASHAGDRRPYLYTQEQLERAQTHDPLWNAAQQEMAKRGKMHGYLRMYWAKKILEWSETPAEALATALFLNDRYELDGRDPNGYAGCAWAIGGLHDRPWFSGPVFGAVRTMTASGCRRKFDVDAYIAAVERL